MVIKIFKTTGSLKYEIINNKKRPLFFIEKGLCYINKAHPDFYIFNDVEKYHDEVRDVVRRAIIKAVPENTGMSEKDLDKEINRYGRKIAKDKSRLYRSAKDKNIYYVDDL